MGTADSATEKGIDQARARDPDLPSILETVPDAMIVIDERGPKMSYSAAAQPRSDLFLAFLCEGPVKLGRPAAILEWA